MKVKALILTICFIITNLHASEIDGEMLAKKLHLMAGYKAIMQWERVFKSQKKMKRYKIDTLEDDQRLALKRYLIAHAIDSDHPTVAGEF
jgi:hypothetical protein